MAGLGGRPVGWRSTSGDTLHREDQGGGAGVRRPGPRSAHRCAAFLQVASRDRPHPRVDAHRRARDHGSDAIGPAGHVRVRDRGHRRLHLQGAQRAGERLLRARRRREERRVSALSRRAGEDRGRRSRPLRLRARLQVLRVRRHAGVPDQRDILTRAARAVRHLREAVHVADDLDQAERARHRNPQGRGDEDGCGDGVAHLHECEVQGSGGAIRRQLSPARQSGPAGGGRSTAAASRRQPGAYGRYGGPRREHTPR